MRPVPKHPAAARTKGEIAAALQDEGRDEVRRIFPGQRLERGVAFDAPAERARGGGQAEPRQDLTDLGLPNLAFDEEARRSPAPARAARAWSRVRSVRPSRRATAKSSSSSALEKNKTSNPRIFSHLAAFPSMQSTTKVMGITGCGNGGGTGRKGWWTVGDSNPRPLHCERSVLPTELTAHPRRA